MGIRFAGRRGRLQPREFGARQDAVVIRITYETPEKLAQDAFRTARARLAQERAEIAETLADASARPSEDAA